MKSDSWRPDASVATLRRRADLLAAIRAFMAEQHVMEVDTPLLSAAAATDPHLASLCVTRAGAPPAWLVTSPEFALKRLLAAGSGDIYQLGHVFRADEQGRWHNPEFCMLEWYRQGWDMRQLMEEVTLLLQRLLARPVGCDQVSYAELFHQYTGLDAFTASTGALAAFARAQAIAPPRTPVGTDRDYWLDLILSLRITPALGRQRPVFVTGFPVSQASLTRTSADDPATAERFELYWRGVELANGGNELIDPQAVARRFAADQAQREQQGLEQVPRDERLLAAVQQGLPDCAGVALGVDRLLALLLERDGIGSVLAFTDERA